MEEKYTIEQIVEAIMRDPREVIAAIRYEDKEMLEDILRDYLA